MRYAKLSDWLDELTAECPKKIAHNMNEPRLRDAGSQFLRICPSEQPLQRSLHWIILTGVGVGGNGLTRRWLGRVRLAPALGSSALDWALPLQSSQIGRDGGS